MKYRPRSAYAYLQIPLLFLTLFLLLSCSGQNAGRDIPDPESAEETAAESKTDADTAYRPGSDDGDTALPETESAVPDTAEPSPAQETETLTTEETETDAPTVSSRISVPRLRGLTWEEARQILEDAGLTYTASEIYSDQEAAGRVCAVHFMGTIEEATYSVNAAYPVEVTVSLGSRPIINVQAADEKRIYLTFDDGPCAGTDEVLEILAAYDVKATFFTLGMYAAIYPERIKAISDAGHLLGCHSYSHAYMELYQSAETVLDEIDAWKRAVAASLGEAPESVVFRFPGGAGTYYMDDTRFTEIFWALIDAGYTVFDWTFADNDRYPAGKPEEQSMEDYLKTSTVVTLDNCEASPLLPKIMLMHDTSKETIAVLSWIIEYLQGEGYTFGTLDELDGYWIAR
ncbi:MAG: polysaccharide deacetylase family protein [Eubacteriales bacterium]